MEYVSINEATALTGLSRRTIERRIKSGVIEIVKEGNKIFIPKTELEKLNKKGD